MDILQLLNLLFFAPDDKIIKAALPDLSCFKSFLPQTALGRHFTAAPVRKHSAGKSLLQYLHDRGWSSTIRFADQQMNVLGHDHVSDDDETAAHAHLLQDFEKQIPPADGPQQRSLVITARGDEVQVSFAVVTMKTTG